MKTRLHKTTWSCFASVVGAMFLLPAAVWPEERPGTNLPVTVGSRVRLVAPSLLKGRIEGLVMEMDEKSLLVSSDDRLPVKVFREAITCLEVSTGRHRKTLKGMVIGGSIGALLGISFKSDNCDNAVSICSESLGGAMAFGAVGGAGWGAIIGSLIKHDTWNEVPIDRVRVSLIPTRGRGVALSLSVAL
jgi:hypothetical protein